MPNTDLPKTVPNPQTKADLDALLPNPGTPRDPWTFFEGGARHPLEKTLDFRQVNAWWMIEMCYLTYATDPGYAVSQLRAAGLDGQTFGFENDQPPHILVAHNSEIIAVAFRGTRVDALADILADITFLPTLTSTGLVHSGFQHALLAGGVWDDAKRHLRSIPGEQAIFFTGHSLGAALATLARGVYRDPMGRQHALYTFGSPRVGDELMFCSHYPAHAYRVVNDEDAVTHVPTPPVYGHVGSAYGPNGQLLPHGAVEQLEHAFAGAGAALAVFSLAARKQRLREWLAGQACKPIGDHAPRSYATKIWNALLTP